MGDSRDRYKGSQDFAGSGAPNGKRKASSSSTESWYSKGSPDFAGFDSKDAAMVVLKMSFVWQAAKMTATRLIEKFHQINPPNLPNNPPKSDMKEFGRFVRELLEQKLDVILKRFDGVEKRVDHVVESSVRNESHMKQVNEQYKAFEQSIQELIKSAKESLSQSQEMKVLLDAHMKEFKALNEKSQIELMDKSLKDLETAATLPGRILELCDKALYCLGVLQILLLVAVIDQTVPSEVTDKLKAVKPKLDQLASKLEELPKKCQSVQLQKCKFTDLGRNSADLLHSCFQSGPNSGYYLSYSADATAGALALICGDGAPLSVNVADSLFLKLKTNATRDLTVVRGTFSFPDLEYYGVFKPGFSVSVPASSVNLHYLHEYGGLLASIERGVNPLVSLSGVFGLKAFSLGADLGFNPVEKIWTKYEAGLRCNTSGLDIALVTKNKMDKISASVCYRWGESVAAGFENRFNLSTKVHEMIVGFSRCLDPMTTLKARIGFKARLRKPDDPEDGKLLFDKSAVGGLALLRRWGTCAGGVSVEVDLQKNMAPRFGVFLKFGAPKVRKA